MKNNLKILIPSTLTFALTPLTIVLSCANTSNDNKHDQEQDNDQKELTKIVSDLNSNPPKWSNQYPDGKIPEGEWDEIIKNDQNDLLLDKLTFEKVDNYDYQVVEMKVIQDDKNPDQGTVSFQIKVLASNGKFSTTNKFTLNYTKFFISKLLSAQKQNYNQMKPGDIKLKAGVWPEFYDPSTIQYFKATAMHPQLNFETWKNAMFDKFIKIEVGLDVKVKDFRGEFIIDKDNKEQGYIFIDFLYQDSTTKETWSPPSLKFKATILKKVLLAANQVIIPGLAQADEFKLNQELDNPLNEQNLLANTNFDLIKDTWMVSTDLTYEVVDFQQNSNVINFKIKISRGSETVTTDLITFKIVQGSN